MVLFAGVAFVVTVGFGLFEAKVVVENLRHAGFSAQDVDRAFRSELERWIALASATTMAVLAILALDQIERPSVRRWMEALLVLLAPFALLCVGVAAYWPERELIRHGSYVNVGEIPLFWGVICGGPVLVVQQIVRRWPGTLR